MSLRGDGKRWGENGSERGVSRALSIAAPSPRPPPLCAHPSLVVFLAFLAASALAVACCLLLLLVVVVVVRLVSLSRSVSFATPAAPTWSSRVRSLVHRPNRKPLPTMSLSLLNMLRRAVRRGRSSMEKAPLCFVSFVPFRVPLFSFPISSRGYAYVPCCCDEWNRCLRPPRAAIRTHLPVVFRRSCTFSRKHNSISHSHPPPYDPPSL